MISEISGQFFSSYKNFTGCDHFVLQALLTIKTCNSQFILQDYYNTVTIYKFINWKEQFITKRLVRVCSVATLSLKAIPN